MFGTKPVDYFGIMEMAKKNYGKLMAPLCEAHSLTKNEADVLLFLRNNPGYDRAADIVSRRGIAKSHVSLSVANLESYGLILRRFDENDRRTAHLELTAQGRGIADEARKLQRQFLEKIYRGISPEEFEVWGNITEKVWNNIRDLDNK